MGDYEVVTLVMMESSLKYHPSCIEVLIPQYSGRHCVVGSLTGVVASKRVTEACKGTLSMVGNHARSILVEGCLTATLTGGAGAKAG